MSAHPATILQQLLKMIAGVDISEVEDHDDEFSKGAKYTCFWDANLVDKGTHLLAFPFWHFTFGFYKEGQGFAVGIWLSDGSPDKTVVWTANNRDQLVSANATLGLTKDDKLVSTGGGQTKSIVDKLVEPIYSASMLDNGNFVLYSSNSKIIWQTFSYPAYTILAGRSLILHPKQRSGQDLLFSSVSKTNHTIGRENHTVSLNLTDGWPSSKDTLVIYRATLDVDGIFRLYSHSMRKNNNSAAEFKWQSLYDKCSVYGSCGINSYCILGEPINCTCVPGFDYVNSSETSVGCEMRWGDRGFGSIEDKRMTPEIVSFPNTLFKHDHYSLVENMVQEDRKEACSTDANCVAALYQYSDTNCYKLKFPLRYGQKSKDRSVSRVLFVKLANRDSAREKHTSSISKTSIMILVIGAILTICSGITMAVFGYLISRRGLWAHVKSCEDKLGTTEDIVLRSFSYKACHGYKWLQSSTWSWLFWYCL
ncbi:hypothetical protein MRB53_013847 [Persea americana]|uniref:Uncharacterized protein n=1 Tax=Persea americana TaxID=3435 RepID=A0ACC2K9I4_PERAE|nr:hypothetical protein MRB53_013847 [Persea americana]